MARRAIIVAVAMMMGPLLLAFPAPASSAPANPPTTLPITLDCDLIEYDGALDQSTSEELTQVHAVHDATQVLRRHKVRFTRLRSMVSLALPPDLYRAIAARPHGEPFVLPSRGGGIICGPLT